MQPSGQGPSAQACGRVRIPKSAGVTSSPRSLSHPRARTAVRPPATQRQRPPPAATRTVAIFTPPRPSPRMRWLVGVLWGRPRAEGRPGGPGMRPAARNAPSRPDGGSLPQRGAPADPSVPGHVNAFEAPPCAPGAALHHHSAPARRPSADRTTHSNEKRLLSISKSSLPIRLCRRNGRELDEGRPDHPVMGRQ